MEKTLYSPWPNSAATSPKANDHATIALYLHVPFCHAKCAYCSFFSLPVHDKDPQITLYCHCLKKEIEIWGKELQGQKIHSIFFGGGTPSLLSAEQLEAILDSINQYFCIIPNCEISIECNPESAIKHGWLHDIQSTGINRISLGVQSFLNSDLLTLGRIHKAETSELAVQMAQKYFSNINIDLMWGLAHFKKQGIQQLKQWLNNLNKAATLGVQHLSCYGLHIEEGTSFHQLYEQGQLLLAEEASLEEMYLQTCAFLESKGYQQYEISNFAQEGFSCMHNLSYWEQKEYLGFGPSAVSTWQKRRWENPSSLQDWSNRLQAVEQSLPVIPLLEGSEYIDEEKEKQESILLSLRMTKGLDLKAWKEKYAEDFVQKYHALIKELIQRNLAQLTESHFSLSPKGFLVSNEIMERFF